jgi:hypothetical protein
MDDASSIPREVLAEHMLALPTFAAIYADAGVEGLLRQWEKDDEVRRSLREEIKRRDLYNLQVPCADTELEALLKPIAYAHYDVVDIMNGPVGLLIKSDGTKCAIEATTFFLGESYEEAKATFKRMLLERPESKYYLSLYTFNKQVGCSSISIQKAFDGNRYLKERKYPEGDKVMYSIRCSFKSK